MRLISAFILCFVSLWVSAASPIQHPYSGRIDRKYIFSPEMNDTMTVDIWLPEDYLKNPQTPLPVLYMHDGQNLFDASTTWNLQAWKVDSVAASLNDARRMEPVIIVGVHNITESRVADLMPQDIFNDSTLRAIADKMLDKPLRGNAYAKFLSTTLRDSINNSYNTLTDPANTAVMGSSMGGLMSLYILCEYPETFGKAACLSTHWIGSYDDYVNGDERFPAAMYEYVKNKIPRDGLHKIYFDRGTATLDAQYGKWDDRIISLCGSLGYTPSNLSSYVDEGASHEENAWMKRVWRPLLFLFPADKGK